MIKNFSDFIKEAISGTELVGLIGPSYGDTKTRNKTISTLDTDVIYSDIDGKIYTRDEYYDLYNNYLKSGGKPLDGFTLDNISIILNFIYR